MHVCLSCSQHFAGSWTCPACGYTPALHKGYLTFAPELADSSDQYAAAFFERLAALEDGHFWFEARSRLLIRALRRHFPQAKTLLDTAVLAQMHRSLRPGGGLMLTVPQHPALWSRMAPPRHKTRLSAQ